MIITITGKPCSGKSTVAKMFAEKFNFKHFSTGDLFRKYAKEYGYDILTFQQDDERANEIDELVDTKIKNLGKTKIDEDLIIDSRLAWHFIPKSFKVFIDISDDIAGQRLITSNRETEKITNLQQAIESLKLRWQLENNRYQKLYNVNNFNHNNYNLVINSDELEPYEIIELIHEEYLKFLKKIKRSK